MTGVVRHALAELERAGLIDSESVFYNQVMDLIMLYGAQRHNDGSRVLATFARLSSGMPLTELTGEDNEWVLCGDGVYQNTRCGTVFKDASGAYDTMAFVFENPLTGAQMVSEKSRVSITFPYYPRVRIVQMSPPGAADETLPVAGQPGHTVEG